MDYILDIMAEDRYIDFLAAGIHLKSFTFDENKFHLNEFITVVKYILELLKVEENFVDY